MYSYVHSCVRFCLSAGLQLDCDSGTLSLYLNGARCGVLWDELHGKRLSFAVQLSGESGAMPPAVR